MGSYRIFISLLAVVIGSTTNFEIAQADHIDGPLFSVPQVKTGWHTSAIDFADVNSDGKTDAVTANTTDQTLSILIGDGKGSHVLSGAVTAGTHPVAIVLRDFNNDGFVDAAVADRTDDTVQIFDGDGAGNFSAGPSLAVGATPIQLVAGDFNGDHLPDLAVLRQVNGVGILINNTGVPGTFTLTGEVMTIPEIVYDIDSGDSDGDGDFDLVISSGAGMTLLPNDGAGTFTEGAPVISANRANALTFVDFDGDGDLDLATADNERSISIAENTGRGNFSAAVPHAIGGSGRAMSIDSADLDGDGREEIVALWDQTSESAPGRLIIANRDPAGPISIEEYQTATRPLLVRATGIDDDGRLDIALLATVQCTRRGCIWQGSLNVLLNRGLAGFGNYTTAYAGDGPRDTVAADFNGDGNMDIAVANFESQSISIMANDGTGRFVEIDTFSPTESGGQFSLVAGDFDADGDEDIVFSTAFTEIFLARNRGDGIFSASRIHFSGRSPVLSAADMDGDGDIDVVAVSGIIGQLGRVEILSNDGAGNFSVWQAPDRPQEGLHRTALVDIDGDRDFDVVLGQEIFNSGYQMSLLLYRNNGAGILGAPTEIPLGTGRTPVGLAAGDIDDDGDNDIVVGDAQNATVRVLTNTAGILSPAVSLAASPELRDVAVADLDEDGLLDIIAANGIHSEVNGTASVPAESVQTWYGESAGEFSAPQAYMSGWTPTGISIAPFTRTGRLDIAVADERNGDIWLLKRSEFLLRIDIDWDGLTDFLEIDLGLDISDPDSDDDGLFDGIDPSMIGDVIEEIPLPAFKNAGAKQALISKLKGAEQQVIRGHPQLAIKDLQHLSGSFDGCLTSKNPDRNDSIVDCKSQFKIRNLQDVVITNLQHIEP